MTDNAERAADTLNKLIVGDSKTWQRVVGKAGVLIAGDADEDDRPVLEWHAYLLKAVDEDPYALSVRPAGLLFVPKMGKSDPIKLAVYTSFDGHIVFAAPSSEGAEGQGPTDEVADPFIHRGLALLSSDLGGSPEKPKAPAIGYLESPQTLLDAAEKIVDGREQRAEVLHFSMLNDKGGVQAASAGMQSMAAEARERLGRIFTGQMPYKLESQPSKVAKVGTVDLVGPVRQKQLQDSGLLTFTGREGLEAYKKDLRGNRVQLLGASGADAEFKEAFAKATLSNLRFQFRDALTQTIELANSVRGKAGIAFDMALSNETAALVVGNPLGAKTALLLPQAALTDAADEVWLLSAQELDAATYAVLSGKRVQCANRAVLGALEASVNLAIAREKIKGIDPKEKVELIRLGR